MGVFAFIVEFGEGFVGVFDAVVADEIPVIVRPPPWYASCKRYTDHGLSGPKRMIRKMGIGQTHWTA
jgi:hypothetical protein